MKNPLLILWLLIGLTNPGQAQGALPNFVMFITDDQGVYHSNPYGASEMRTPNMQSMADITKDPEGYKLAQGRILARNFVPMADVPLPKERPKVEGIR